MKATRQSFRLMRESELQLSHFRLRSQSCFERKKTRQIIDYSVEIFSKIVPISIHRQRRHQDQVPIIAGKSSTINYK